MYASTGVLPGIGLYGGLRNSGAHGSIDRPAATPQMMSSSEGCCGRSGGCGGGSRIRKPWNYRESHDHPQITLIGDLHSILKAKNGPAFSWRTKNELTRKDMRTQNASLWKMRCDFAA